ncbi:resolvase [Streptomyces sp. NBRC 110611]|uniref:hypothetical protein n=1 Tax=Streptomyces sp. NBRC 110611 TaxID=1621259 RepID=UPI000856DECB|nr:hypothetical protein [Streptomyces sp. NBRC 110611]GAU71595.1 resolvase [Streptomyces sp. NBRC 110611]
MTQRNLFSYAGALLLSLMPLWAGGVVAAVDEPTPECKKFHDELLALPYTKWVDKVREFAAAHSEKELGECIKATEGELPKSG